MNKNIEILKLTIKDITQASNKISPLVLTRYAPHSKTAPNDLDVLTKKSAFRQIVNFFTDIGYHTKSHDNALGGRIKGAQLNIIKQDRIKIDLHKDFTWRKKRYFDLKLVWSNLVKKEIVGNQILTPKTELDAFIVLVNVIFEKSYIVQQDYKVLDNNLNIIFKNKMYLQQAERYGWILTFTSFRRWWESDGKKLESFPAFLPFGFIMISYFEKFDLISFFYYFFFKARYLLNKTLPYE